MSDVILEANQVSRDFRIRRDWLKAPTNLRAVREVSLKVTKGETLALVGESGSGKTTLFNLLLGMDRPSAGNILIDGVDVTTMTRREIARRIQPVFQDPYDSLNPRQTVAEIIATPMIVHGIGSKNDRRARVRRMMDLLGLPSRLENAFPRQLSGGQRQRVAIARALAMEVDVVICDEPTSALDVSVQAQILNLLADIRQELGVTFVLISHDLGVIQFLAQRVMIMHLGQIVEEAPTSVLFGAPAHPYTRALVASILAPDPAAPLPTVPMGTAQPNPTAPPSGCTFHPRCPAALPLCSELAPQAITKRDGGWVACHRYEESIDP